LKTRTIKIGVIGGGEGATKAISALINCKAVQINAVVCDDKELTGLIKPAIRVSMHDLLHVCDVDAVYIATPNNTHIDLAIDVLRAGKHVMMEKPVAVSFSEASRLISHKQTNFSIAVAFKKRYGDWIEYFKKHMVTSRHPITINVRWYNPAPQGNWRYIYAISGGGVVMDIGSHVIDLLEVLFGQILDIEVKLKMSERFPQIDEEALIKLFFFNGHSATIELSWLKSQSCQIYSFFSLEKEFHLKRQYDGTDLGTFKYNKETTNISFNPSMEYVGLFTAWRDSIEKNERLVPQLDDGLRNQSIMQVIYSECYRKPLLSQLTVARNNFN